MQLSFNRNSTFLFSDGKPFMPVIRRSANRRMLLRWSALFLFSTTTSSGIFAAESEEGKSVDSTTQVLLQPWRGPYGGVPPWNEVRPEEFVENFTAAIALAQQEIDSTASMKSVVQVSAAA